jgi:hypothetical protein
MGLYLKEARKPTEFTQGDYFQQELQDVLVKIWENQNHLEPEDLIELKKYT